MDAIRKSTVCTTREAALALGVSLRTAQLWTENGILEAWKTDGGHRRISVASVNRLLHQDTAGAAPRQGDDGRLRVLVVEDDNVLLKLYQLRIAAWRLPVDLSTASNGYEALMQIGRASPDLLITDLNMPGIDGFQMIHTLAASAFREGMEIVIVSGLDAHQIAEKGGLPADIRHFTKPVPFATLCQIAQQLLARRAAL